VCGSGDEAEAQLRMFATSHTDMSDDIFFRP
jgi:hypothetical protein